MLEFYSVAAPPLPCGGHSFYSEGVIRSIPLSATALRLAGYSALILFFELAFIRYTSAYVRVFSFYLNFVLLATFLGMGVGLLRAEQAARLRWVAVPGTLLLVGGIAVFNAVHISMPPDPNEYVWGILGDATGARGIPLLPVVAALFALCALFFLPLGALLGAEFRKLPPLDAYSADISGSLAGIILFGVLSANRTPPLVWFALGFGAWVLLSWNDRRFAVAVALTGIAALSIASRTGRVRPEYWSPYYRINVVSGQAGLNVNVNGALHQVMMKVDEATAARVPYVGVAYPAYIRPYRYATRLDTALVVGAGTGNDLALLLRGGSAFIDAVEIDPTIADLGKAAHPLDPYADSRVHLHVDDARAFLRKTRQRYDVIVFGTLDSQTLLSGMSSVRLDNYVYTVESFRSARARLKPGGTLIVYHMAGTDYIAAKLYQMIEAAFEQPPGVFAEYDNLFNYTFVAGHGARDVPAVAPAGATALATRTSLPHDDWPYLYLQGRTIPAHYVIALGAVFVISLAFIGIGGGATVRRGWDAPMFFMGAGFMLVETKSVTEMSLLFGSTWTVNLLVFASILVMVLIANLVIQHHPFRRTVPLFASLLVSLGLAYALPASALLRFGTLMQWLVGGLMVSLPVLFAALIFSALLVRRPDAFRALAWNLLGAIVGGMLEYSSMALGIKALYLIAAVTYGCAAAWVVRDERRAAAG